MSSAERRRRTRRIALLLSAILIPTAAVLLLLVRVVRQERELSERVVSEQRREALDQLRRELTARLQALRLEEVNRLIGESGRRLPPDSPIVFVASMTQDRLVLPWEADRPAPPPLHPVFADALRAGEAREFREQDPAAAVAAYRASLQIAPSSWEMCTARIALARSYVKAGLSEDAATVDGEALKACGEAFDEDGIPLALYAADRILSRAPRDAAAAEYVMRRARAPRWRSPSEAYLLQSLLRRLADVDTAPSKAMATELRHAEQVTALVEDVHDHLGRLKQASRTAPGDLSWMGYGDEPWLLTLVSPTSFATPVVMAVSSARLLPAGVALRTTSAADATPLGDGFVDLHVTWPAGRFAAQPAVPRLLYGSMLCAVLGSALLAGYLLLRDVHRETETAALRSHFVASVSHELKTPLTSIRAHAETLLLGRADSAQATSDYLKTIVSESERLGRLVESVLDFSRVEQGRKAYDLRDTPLEDVVWSAAKTMEHPLAQFGFTLHVSSDGSAPTLRADPEALTQALLNLLGNAMKYSGDARTIEIHMGTRDGHAFVDIVDHGIGIARGDQARIFERFHRVQTRETAGIAGTGLGLSLALHVVEAHKGRIGVVSAPGRGSTFSVSIPMEARA